jgi:hypothetical protein
MNKQDLNEFQKEIKIFFGEEWFQAECDKAGPIPSGMNTHPVVSSWINTDRFVKNKHMLPGMNITPRNEILNVIMLGTYLRLIDKATICDLSGNIIDKTIKDHFQHRLKTPTLFHSALYELKIASSYLREGYAVNFIDDKSTQPEFFISVNGEKVYVECKRLEKPRLNNAPSVSDTCNKIIKKIERLLIDNKVGVLIVCNDNISNNNDWIVKKIKSLISKVGIPSDETVGDYYFKLFDPSLTVRLQGHDSFNNNIFFEEHYIPFLNRQFSECSISFEDIPFVSCTPKINCSTFPPSQTFEMESFFGVAFRTLQAHILGVKKLISKASHQLPKSGIGIVYVETPPFDASDEEIKEFQRVVNNELNASERINALVLTGLVNDGRSVQHISNVIMNNKSTSKLPADFHIIPLLDKFVIDEGSYGKFPRYY